VNTVALGVNQEVQFYKAL